MNTEKEIETVIEYPIHYHGHIEMFIDDSNVPHETSKQLLKDYGDDADLLGI